MARRHHPSEHSEHFIAVGMRFLQQCPIYANSEEVEDDAPKDVWQLPVERYLPANLILQSYQGMPSQSCINCKIHFHNLVSATNMPFLSLGGLLMLYCVFHSDTSVNFLAMAFLRVLFLK